MTYKINESDVSNIEQQGAQYLKNRQWALLVLLIEQNASQLLSTKNNDTVKQWLEAIPENFKFNNNYLLWLGVNLFPGYIQKISTWFQKKFQAKLAAKEYQQAFAVWTDYANVKFYYLDRFSDVLLWLNQADKLLKIAGFPENKDSQASFFAAYFNALLLARPDRKQLIYWAKRLKTELLHCQNIYIKTNIYNHLILYNIWVGNMREARLLHKESLGLVHHSVHYPFNVMMQSTMFSMMEWLHLKVDSAVKEIKKGMDYGNKIQVKTWHAQMTAQLVYAYICKGDFTEARRYLNKMELNKDAAQLLDSAQYHYLSGWLNLSEDRFVDAETHLLRAIDASIVAGVVFPEAVIRICLAQVYFSQNRLLESIKQLAKAQWIGRWMGSKHLRYAGLLAQSWVMQCWKNTRLSSHYLKKAFKLAAEEEYVVIPGWPHKIMQCLLEKAFHENIEIDYVKFLILKHKIKPTGQYPIHPDWPWQININCFADFQIFVQGKIHLNSGQTQKGKPQKKPLELIQLLALYPEGLPRYKMADFLYGDTDADKAMQALDTTIFRARKILQDKQAIIFQHGELQGRYLLNPKICHSDIAALNLILQKNPAKLSVKHRKNQFEQIKALYSNTDNNTELLVNATESVWLVAKRESIRNNLITYLNQCANKLDFEDEVALRRYIIDLDETIEKSYQDLIILYSKQGSHIEAEKVWRKCKRALSRNFALEPSQKIRNLIKRCNR